MGLKPRAPVPRGDRRRELAPIGDGPASSAERPLIIGLPKGRILKQAVALFGDAGYDLSAALGESRKLQFDCGGGIHVMVLRSADVPTYVAYGAADIGVAGRDVLDEQGRTLYEPLDLRIGACRLVIAEPSARPVDLNSQLHLRIATKYPRITRSFLQRRGITADVIKLNGAVELAPLVGLSDQIVDLVETGETMRQNGLVEVETILDVTSRLVVNPASLKLRSESISQVIERVERAVAQYM